MTENISSQGDAAKPRKFKTYVSDTVSRQARDYQRDQAVIVPSDPTVDNMPDVRKATAELYQPLIDEAKQKFVERLESTEIAGVPVLTIVPKNYNTSNEGKCIFYIHGGAYVMGDPLSLLMFTAPLAYHAGIKISSVDYRLAPEHPYPAAADDCFNVYGELIKRYRPQNLALCGDSAGGALSLVTALRASRRGMALPAVMALSSPWADITKTGDSYHLLEGWDCLIQYEMNLGKPAEVYAGNTDWKDPDISPLYADYPAEFPPVLIVSGTRDLLLSCCARLQRVMKRAGIEVHLDVWEGMWHDFIGFPFLPECREALKEIAAFITSRI
ncbi:MAG: alpha/beta hydrolase [Dehalococcoidia bacterium]|nr:alpha/beta hydrolase [Dehalococcoidia bacterium]MDD5493796.1 alpha/beta hydrolase [Dehalococcoidia bacterium]